MLLTAPPSLGCVGTYALGLREHEQRLHAHPVVPDRLHCGLGHPEGLEDLGPLRRAQPVVDVVDVVRDQLSGYCASVCFIGAQGSQRATRASPGRLLANP
jgi:hypothetical protein